MYTRDIKQWLISLRDGELILAKQAYEEVFNDMKEATFYQLLARLCQNNVIGKIAKGLYFKHYKNDLEKLPTTDQLISFFTNKNRNGMIVGTNMLYKLGIVEQPSDVYEVYTNAIEIKTRRCISSLVLQSIDVDYRNAKVLNTIMMLEIIEIIDSYENICLEKLEAFVKEFATNFDANTFNKVLNKKQYKKRNIATVKFILDCYQVPNNLQKYLNSASKYMIPAMIGKVVNMN